MTVLLKSVLVLVFAAAGVGKLTDREGSREEVVAFGVPAALGPPVAAVLPLFEIAVAVAIAVPATARWGVSAALALLLLYTAAIGINLLLGRKPECKCFGPLISMPVGWKPLVRNLVLSAAAVLLLVRL